MVPAKFVLLTAFPLTPTGKIDRQALPDPGNLRPELTTPFAKPTTPLETRLAQIWGRALNIEGVGMHDNFFDLGGHSLTATRLLSQVVKEFQLELPLHVLFQSPTLAEMVVVIAEHQERQPGTKDLACMIDELESLSDDEAQRLLADADPSRSKINEHE
jgi:hypothetical protein